MSPSSMDVRRRGTRVFRAAFLALAAGMAALGAFPGASAAAVTPADPGTRAPARSTAGESSIGFLFGVGWYDNTSFNRDLVENGIPPIENGFEYGLQYRKRVSRWFSIGAELGRMDGRTNPVDGSNTEYGIAATPLLVEVFAHPLETRNGSVSLFAGIGPMIGTRLGANFPDGSFVEGRRAGLCREAGVELEGRFGPNFGFFVRGLARRAEATDIVLDDGTGAETVRYDVDFDGQAVTFGPRWYFGGR
jgi:hypothetical protein